MLLVARFLTKVTASGPSTHTHTTRNNKQEKVKSVQPSMLAYKVYLDSIKNDLWSTIKSLGDL